LHAWRRGFGSRTGSSPKRRRRLDRPSSAQRRLLAQGEMSFPKHVLQRPMSEIKPFQTEN
jgi:hypothetical protein